MACSSPSCSAHWIERSWVRRRSCVSIASSRRCWRGRTRRNFRLKRVNWYRRTSTCKYNKSRFRIFWSPSNRQASLSVVLCVNKRGKIADRPSTIRWIHITEYRTNCWRFTATTALTVAVAATGHSSAHAETGFSSPLLASSTGSRRCHRGRAAPQVSSTRMTVAGDAAREDILRRRITSAEVAVQASNRGRIIGSTTIGASIVVVSDLKLDE